MELLEHYSHEITTDPMGIYCCAGTGGAMGIYWGIYWSNGYLLEQWVSTGAMGIYWSNGYLLVCRDNGYLLSITHRSEDYISSDTVNALVTIAETTKHC